MILGIIILTASVLGLGYAMYSSNVENKEDSVQELEQDWYTYEQQPSYKPQVAEGEVDKLLNQIVEHLHAYAQYYEQKVGECHNCMELAQGCMALEPGSKERLALYKIMEHDVTEFNRYMRGMKSFSQNELDQGGSIALELKNMHLHNPEQAALFAKCGEEIVPYVISENYMHSTLESNLQYREELVESMKLNVIQRKQEYAETHREMLQGEQEYNHIKAEAVMANAELEAAKMGMEAADHTLALMLGENANLDEHALVNAYATATEQALILKEAEVKAAEVDMARMDMETAKLDMEADNFVQVLIQHHQPGDELHPSLPQGTRIVPGNDTLPPPAGGGGGNEFIQGIGSGIS